MPLRKTQQVHCPPHQTSAAHVASGDPLFLVYLFITSIIGKLGSPPNLWHWLWRCTLPGVSPYRAAASFPGEAQAAGRFRVLWEEFL
jgi:hypothetical protein